MAATAGERRGKPLASVGDLVAGLRARLEQEPDDASGWLLLARSYDHLGRHQEAMIAYQRARMLGRGDADAGESLSDAGQSVGSAGDSGPAIHGRVALSPEAARLVNPDDTIFIFAKESPDQRMPVAALRKPAAELPIDFVLTDAQAMVPGTRIADFEHLVVTARVSRSGLATDILKGFEVWSAPVSPIDGTEIELTIAAGARTGGHRDE
jgi:hypothetical protein